MPEGDFRRPPLLWEQKIANLVAVNAVGSVSGGGTSEVGGDLPPGDGGPPPGDGADPIIPTPAAFSTPSTPTLTGGVQSIMVTWDGLTSTGELYPYESAVVEVHQSTTTGFTPSASTLKGELRYPGNLTITGLTAGTTYHFKLRGRDAAGNFTTASAQASGTTGLTTTNDYGTGSIDAGAVSFNARAIGGITTTVGTTAPTSPVTGDIWLDSTGGSIVHKRWSGTAWVTQAWGSSSLSANCITATQIAAGAVTAGAILAGEVTAAKLSGDAIDGKTITGATFRTSATAGTSTSPRAGIVMDTAGLRGFNSSGTQTININASTGAVTISGYLSATDVGSGGSTSIDGGRITTGTVSASRIDVANLTVEKLTSGPFSSRRVVIGETGATDSVQFKGASTSNGWILAHNAGNSNLSLTSTYGTGTFEIYEDVAITGGISASAATVDFQGVYDNNTTGLAPVGITTTGRLRRNGTSTQRIKYDIAPLAGTLSGSVDGARLCDVSTTDPTSVLDVAVVEFSVIDQGLPTERRLLGFIAEDVRDKLPIAVYEEADGTAGGVNDQAMVAALLAVVKQQQATIDNLSARIDALEA